jgi:lipoprotein-anchoring transpeptidase ErfK/SrfK
MTRFLASLAHRVHELREKPQSLALTIRHTGFSKIVWWGQQGMGLLLLLLVLLQAGCATKDLGRPGDSLEKAVQLQAFLSDKGFGPGIIDGKPGEFTYKALRLYEEATRAIHLTEKPTQAAFTTYYMSGNESEWIGEIPEAVEDQAKHKRMPYTSRLEFIAERYHALPGLLIRLNPGLNFETAPVGTPVRVPNVQPFRIDQVPEIVRRGGAEKKRRNIRIDTKERMLRVEEAGQLLAAFPITPGSSELPAPSGDWKVVNVVPHPWFRYDESMLKLGVRSSEFHNIPPGPNSPVGVVWIGLSKSGIGLHGTSTPETIGRAASHGCVRLANWDAVRLAALVAPGSAVRID